jgi:hypothetical protein
MSLTGEIATAAARVAGGEADVASDGRVYAVLSAEAAAAAKMPEVIELPPEAPYDPALAESARRLLGSRGRRDAWWPGQLYLKSTGLEELVARELTARNGVIRTLGSEPAYALYDAHLFRYSAVSEDNDEGVVEVVSNSVTGRVVPALAERLGCLPRSADETPRPEAGDRAASFLSAAAEAERIARARIADFTKSLERRASRDERRLREYYGALSSQLDRRRGRSAASAAEKKRAVAAELERKLAELELRYAVRVTLAPVCVASIVLPAMRVRTVLVRRKVERRAGVFWNPVLKAIEPLACESCLASAPVFSLCDACAHVVCRACAEHHDLRRACTACEGKADTPRALPL